MLSLTLATLFPSAVRAAPDVVAEPARIILDTDMAGDCDDAGALALLHALADRGEAEILAVVTNGEEFHGASAATVDAINTWYNRGDLPIGTYKGGGTKFRKKSPFAPAIRDEFPHDVSSDEKMSDAVNIYRQSLAAQPDGSVTIVSVGMLSNLADLLKSKPDDSSPLDGFDLVKRKVKQAVIMGGEYPVPERPETNFSRHPEAAKYAVEHWPTPIVFSGFKVGAAIISGGGLKATPRQNPVRRTYELRPFRGRASLDGGKCSYDQTAVLLAVRGVQPFWELVRGRNILNDQGANRWERDSKGPHAYMVNAVDPQRIASEIDRLMSQAPKGR